MFQVLVNRHSCRFVVVGDYAKVLGGSFRGHFERRRRLERNLDVPLDLIASGFEISSFRKFAAYTSRPRPFISLDDFLQRHTHIDHHTLDIVLQPFDRSFASFSAFIESDQLVDPNHGGFEVGRIVH